MQELWCVRDDQIGQAFRVVCRTLYEIRLKKHLQSQVERYHSIPYSQLWVTFGINIPSTLQTPAELAKKKS